MRLLQMGPERAPVFANFGQAGEFNKYKEGMTNNEVAKSWPEFRRSEGVAFNEHVIPQLSKKRNEAEMTKEWINST